MNQCTPTTCEPDTLASAEPTSDVQLRTPAVDITEDFDSIRVVVSLPGVLREDIQVTFEKNLLVIRGRVRQEETECGGPREYLLREFTTPGYERSFTISEAIDRENISAHHAGGVLTLELPKAAAVKPRSIPVQVGS